MRSNKIDMILAGTVLVLCAFLLAYSL